MDSSTNLIYSSIPKPRNNNFLSLMEVLISYNEIELEDSIFQLSHYFAKVKEFVTVSSVRWYEDRKSQMVDPEYDNKPHFIIWFGIDHQGRRYERVVYSFLNMLGDVGGFYGFI